MTQESTNRRNVIRIPKQFPVEIKKLEYPIQDSQGEVGAVKNIAENGVCLIVSKNYPPKSPISLKIDLKGWRRYLRSASTFVNNAFDTEPMTAIAEVVWSKEVSGTGEYEIGVSFLDIYKDEYDALLKYLAVLEK